MLEEQSVQGVPALINTVRHSYKIILATGQNDLVYSTAFPASREVKRRHIKRGRLNLGPLRVGQWRSRHSQLSSLPSLCPPRPPPSPGIVKVSNFSSVLGRRRHSYFFRLRGEERGLKLFASLNSDNCLMFLFLSSFLPSPSFPCLVWRRRRGDVVMCLEWGTGEEQIWYFCDLMIHSWRLIKIRLRTGDTAIKVTT